MTDKIKAIDLDVGKGGLHLLTNETFKTVTKNIYDSLHKTPSEPKIIKPQCRYRTAYSIPYDVLAMPRQIYLYTYLYGIQMLKYHTLGWNGVLDIKYNFEMAKQFYKNWTDGFLNEFERRVKVFINGLYGEYIYNAVNRCYMQYTPGVQLDIFNWIFGERTNGKERICKNRRQYFYIARSAGKARIK